MNVEVASRVTKQSKIKDLMKLGNFKKIPEVLAFDGEYSAGHSKRRILTLVLEKSKKSAIKRSIEKTILLNFANLYLSTTFCSRL